MLNENGRFARDNDKRRLSAARRSFAGQLAACSRNKPGRALDRYSRPVTHTSQITIAHPLGDLVRLLRPREEEPASGAVQQAIRRRTHMEVSQLYQHCAGKTSDSERIPIEAAPLNAFGRNVWARHLSRDPRQFGELIDRIFLVSPQWCQSIS